MNEIINDIIKKINKANDIAVYCHTNPDGDALGSMLALYIALKNKGKTVSAYCDTPVPQKYKCLYASEDITFPQKRIHELAISVDCSDLDRLGQCMKSYLSARTQIAIDHHKSFARFAETCYVDGNAAACAQLIFKLLKSYKAIDKNIAQLLFSGIVTDSGCFAYSSVTQETHTIACELLEYGFDAADCIYKVFRSTSLNRFELKTRVLSKTRFFEDGKIAIIVFSKEDFDVTSTDTQDTEGIISELIDIDTVKIAYALSEVGLRSYKLSIRTKDPLDAADCANVFGGGGHKNAAGCRINGYLEDIIEKLIKIARDRM